MEKELSLDFMKVVQEIIKQILKNGKNYFNEKSKYVKINPFCAENRPETAIKRKNVPNILSWLHFAPAEWYMKMPRNFDMRQKEDFSYAYRALNGNKILQMKEEGSGIQSYSFKVTQNDLDGNGNFIQSLPDI